MLRMEQERKICPSILYQNSSKTVTLIDIPTSIAGAQSLPGEFANCIEELLCLPTLLSCAPLQEAFPSLEPKTKKARKNVLARQGAQADDGLFKELIYNGLGEIRREYSGDWCLPRIVLPESVSRKRKRKAVESCEAPGEERREEPDLRTVSLGSAIEPRLSGTCPFETTASLMLKDCNSTASLEPQDVSSLVCNLALYPRYFTLPTSPPSTYTIPPNSAFSLSLITSLTASSFSTTLFNLAKCQLTQNYHPILPHFDLIVLDPPWHNKSVTRSGHYSTQRDDPLSSISPMLGTHIAENGMVACWITNKAIARVNALECFRGWNVSLIEEWVWLKVTAKGEPVYDVEGLWKKPFEVLLVGRKCDVRASEAGGGEGRRCGYDESVKRRLIVGVSDLHSRKPSLRTLMEPLVGKGENYRALEVFARNLTAGWVAWGDEVLKFNWEGYWTKAHVDPR